MTTSHSETNSKGNSIMAELIAALKQAKASSAMGKTKPKLSLAKTTDGPWLDEKRFAKIIGILYKAIVNSTGLYKLIKMETHAPQTIYYPGSPAVEKIEEVSSQTDFFLPFLPPPEVSVKKLTVVLPMTLEHRRWLWFATLTDRREISERVYRAHCKIYADHPEFYSSEIVGMDPEEFKAIFRKKGYKVGSPYQSAEYWLVCAKTLFEEFDGDPVKLLKHAGWSVEAVYAWKKSEKKKRGYDPIPGWGRKLLSLYFMYLAELGYPLPDDAFAADVHAQAIPIQTGSIKFGKRKVIYTSPTAEMIRKAATALCKKEGYEVVLVAHAGWLLGSQLCTKCSSRADVPYLCPIYDECKGRIDTGSYFAKGVWRHDGKVMTKGGSRPKFGLPTDISPRDRSRKTTREVIQIIPLYS